MDRKLDPEICACILEFLVRNSIDEELVRKLINVFPPFNPSPRLKKAIILRSIRKEIRDGEVPERILDALEKIERIDNNQNSPIPESMKEAYCAVATDCAVSHLVGNSNRFGSYSDAVKRIWRVRIKNLVDSEASNLVTEELKTRGNDLEAAFEDEDMFRSVIENNTRGFALLSLKKYIREAIASMGPPVLEKKCLEFISGGRQMGES